MGDRTAGRPPIPSRAEYGEGAGEPVPWETVDRLLTASRYFWLATARPDGRPHSIPVWAVWHDGRLYFATAPSTVTGRNLSANPCAVAHLADPREVVIVEGTATRLGASVPPTAVDAYEAKYGWRLDPDDAGMPFYALEPRAVLAWQAKDIRGTAARWRL